MKSRIGPLAEAFAHTCAGIGWTVPSSFSQNQVGLTDLFRLITRVVLFGVDMLVIWSGMPRPGTYGPQLAGLSLTPALSMSSQNSTSLEVTGWPSDHL